MDRDLTCGTRVTRGAKVTFMYRSTALDRNFIAIIVGGGLVATDPVGDDENTGGDGDWSGGCTREGDPSAPTGLTAVLGIPPEHWERIGIPVGGATEGDAGDDETDPDEDTTADRVLTLC